MTTKATKHATEKVAIPTKPVEEIAAEKAEESATEKAAIPTKPVEEIAAEKVEESATEKVEVSIKQVEESAAEKVEVSTKPVEEIATASSSLIGLVRQLLLANVGAVALTGDEIEAFANKLVERGELAQKDAEKLLREVWDQPGAKKAGEQMEQGMAEVLNRLNIPSHRDIEALNARISQLTTSVEELGKSSRSGRGSSA